MKFKELNLADEILASVEEAGFEEATPVQAATIPVVLEGRDVIGQAQTGTGKTAAFGLPTLQKIKPNNKVQALVVSPTRELAIQTQEELYRLGKHKKVRVQAVFGGADINRQIKMLKRGAQIVVGTPGRLLDHIKRGTLDLTHVDTLVLDEADEMLNMGFLEDIEAIIAAVPEERQTLLFSATMPDDIKRIGVQFMKDAEHIKIKAKEMTADLIDQYFVRAKEAEKFDILTRLLDIQRPELAIVFGRTKRRVDELSRGLELRGYKAEGIHGDLSQQKRMNVLRAFKNGELEVLVATDVAARGLDISGVTHVYNFDIPQDPESYVHRIGRTGRAGQDGVSITFVAPNEMSYLQTIERLTKKRMTPLKPPTKKQAFQGQMEAAIGDINQTMAEADLNRYYEMSDLLLETYSARDLAALLLKTVAKEDATSVPVKITPERPLPRRKQDNRRNDRNNRRRNDNYRRDRRNRQYKDKQNKRGKSSNKGNNKKERNFKIRQK